MLNKLIAKLKSLINKVFGKAHKPAEESVVTKPRIRD